MQIDLNKIDYFSMTYIFVEDEDKEAADIVCEYEQTGAPVVAADGNSTTFTLKNIDSDEDNEEYVITLIKKAEDEFYLKSDYFENASELYPLNVEVFDEEVKFSSVGEGEVMYLYGFFA